jgi:myo-inositol 2-dehydrogenase/D-chiro-inositol 1-dehydrogenase
MAKIGIGLIGAGAIGRLHARHLVSRVPGAELVAVADVARGAAEACAHECGVSRVYDDYRELVAGPAVGAVVIASPADRHGEAIEASAAAGKHIFCEKPLEYDLRAADRALAAVAQAGVTLQVGFNRRFDANFAEVREAIVAGAIGRPYLLHIVSRDPLLPPAPAGRPPGWMFFDTTVHDFDMARWLLDDEVTEVRALAGAYVHRGNAAVDTALITLRLAGGALATIDNGQAAYGYDQRIEVLGPAGALAAANELAHGVALSDKTGVRAAGPRTFFAERYSESYVAELAAFVDGVVSGTEPPVTGGDGRAAVVLALAAQRSHEDGGRPVAVSEIAGGEAG